MSRGPRVVTSGGTKKEQFQAKQIITGWLNYYYSDWVQQPGGFPTPGTRREVARIVRSLKKLVWHVV